MNDSRGAGIRHHIKKHMGMFICMFVLDLFVMASLIIQFFNQNYNDVLFCFLALVLFKVPFFIDQRSRVLLPDTLHIIILLFIFCAVILGELREFYIKIPFWDIMLHTVNGFLMAALGFALIDILNRSERIRIVLSPFFVGLVAFCFSMTIGVLWEFFEYGMDLFFQKDMQKDTYITHFNSVALNPAGRNVPVTIHIDSVVVNGEEWPGYLDIGLHDTMIDLFVNFIGALIFCVGASVYIAKRQNPPFSRHIFPRMKERFIKSRRMQTQDSPL
jgi:hypothetical protein